MRGKTLILAILLASAAVGQLYTPIVTKAGQVDASSLQSLVRDIYTHANAKTPRQRAEAIWSFFLTDGRFVNPGFWYHIAGWTYEEPKGEVLDATKLLNSYGFGLCYHIAPLLEAVFEAGGFEDARVWFLTGHTVAEVFYEGGYHYFDSDMMGYNTIGAGPFRQRPVASVRQIEKNGSIILDNRTAEKQADLAKTDQPWYPADVRANAIGDLAALFTTVGDNWVFPFKRYSEGHTMDFVLRPGERMIRYFQPSNHRMYYLPFTTGRAGLHEFPKELSQYQIKTSDGPRSQKDERAWANGRIEYRPSRSAESSFTIDMPCPYVIIDAEFNLDVTLAASDSLTVETSTDHGQSWILAGTLRGPHSGAWQVKPHPVAKSSHGSHSAVSGSYGYHVRFASKKAVFQNLLLATDFQLNPRTLPELTQGRNQLEVRAGSDARTELPIVPAQFAQTAMKSSNAEYVSDTGQGFVRTTSGGGGVILFKLMAPGGAPISGVDVGGRFLDLRAGLAPDKLTAEIRQVPPWPVRSTTAKPSASIAWSLTPDGPWQSLWAHNLDLTWKDGDAITRTLLWPEVDKQVRSLPQPTRAVYVRYSFDGMAIDDFRLAYIRSDLRSSNGTLTHVWRENGVDKRRTESIAPGTHAYSIDLPTGSTIQNIALIMECPSDATLNK